MSNLIDRKEVDGWWECSICHRQFDEGTTRTAHIINECVICQKCHNRGQMWAIREGWKEECFKKGNDY